MSADEWYSQAGQDQWVASLWRDADAPYVGTFLDIGAGHPIERSNTFALESRLHWQGVCIEKQADTLPLALQAGRNHWWTADATLVDWRKAFQTINRPLGREPLDVINYLSLDCDEASLAVMESLRNAGVLGRFRALTIEHDAYRFGDGPRTRMREWLHEAGYRLFAADVCDQGLPFEDWWLAGQSFANTWQMTIFHQDWRSILARP